MAGTIVIYFDSVERQIAAGPEMRNTMQSVVDTLSTDIARGAPRSSGRGHAGGRHAADTLRGVVRESPEGWIGRVEWSRPAYYLRMHDKGTVHLPARPFIQPAIDRYQITT